MTAWVRGLAVLMALSAPAAGGVLVASVDPSARAHARSQAQSNDPSTDRGAALFRQRCGTCHAVAPGARSTMGPHLAGVFGRRAGTAEGYNYTNALKQSDLTWTRETLDAYLAAPTRAVRGTRMVTAVPDPADRSAIISYLEQVR